jgi:hypothetical protein
VRATVDAGDYAVHRPDGALVAAVERKSLDNLASTLSDASLAFQVQRLTELPLAAIVVEARYGALFKLEHVNGNWLADQRPPPGPLPQSPARLRRAGPSVGHAKPRRKVSTPSGCRPNWRQQQRAMESSASFHGESCNRALAAGILATRL